MKQQQNTKEQEITYMATQRMRTIYKKNCQQHRPAITPDNETHLPQTQA